MDVAPIVLFLAKKSMNATEIYQEINAVLGEKTISYSSVTRYLRERSFRDSSAAPDPEVDFDAPNLVEQAIQEALDERPFSSLRQLAKRILVPMSTVRYHLVNCMGYKLKHVRWVPHTLSTGQKTARVERSRDLLSVLQSVRHQGWKFIVTMDEAWFYLSNNFDQIWMPHDEIAPDCPRRMVSTPKIMITIAWNPLGFHAAEVLPKGAKWTAKYYVETILPKIARLREKDDHRWLIVHADNARPHTARVVGEYMDANCLRKAPHPPYSPDLAPCDFFLFGYIKEKLKGFEFANGEELLSAINEILAAIPADTLLRVFHEWMERLERCIELDGDYVE